MTTNFQIIDAWAQPAQREAFAKLPEIARLFKQSGSAHLIEHGLTTAQIVAEMDRLGPYHLCSLFSPALEFATHEEARLTALAAMDALLRGAADGPDAPRPAPTRRAFLGLAP